MKVFRKNENAVRPTFKNHKDAVFNLKACFEPGDRVRLLNPLNKETYAPAKVVQGKTVVQVYPQQRMLIPTGLIFFIPDDCVLKMYSHPSISKTKGLMLSSGVELVRHGDNGEVHVMITNVTDGVSLIETGEDISLAQLEKMHEYSISEITELPSDDVAEDA